MKKRKKRKNKRLRFKHLYMNNGFLAQEKCPDDDEDVLPNLDFCSESDLSTSPFSLNLCQSEDTVNLSLKIEDRHENLMDTRWLMHDKDDQFAKKKSEIQFEE